MRQKKKRILVTAKAEDPLFEEGRARLIWASNTANACSALGFSTFLSHQEKAVERSGPLANLGRRSIKRPPENFRDFYNVRNSMRIIGIRLPGYCKLVEKSFLKPGNLAAKVLYPRSFLKKIDLVHTRDWRIVVRAVNSGIPTIYEDHFESFHRAIDDFPAHITRNPAFKLAVGITEKVRSSLIERGMPYEKTAVFSSGLNEHSLKLINQDERAWIRHRILGPDESHRKIVAYAGGLHTCRGIDFILKLAKQYSDMQFVLMGGRSRQVKQLNQLIQKNGVSNISLTGYQSHTEVPQILQSADYLLMPYNDSNEAHITSPLKFYEYLAAGTPFVASKVPSISDHAANPNLSIEWSDICDYSSFEAAFKRLLQHSPERSEYNRIHHYKLAAQYTWLNRQRSILAFADMLQSQTQPIEPLMESITPLQASFSY